MKPLKEFDEFIKLGIMRKRTPDISRARSLINESEKRKKFLEEMSNKIQISDDNANYFIENSYDTLIELIRAKILTDGFSSSGEGAHEAEVSYMKVIGFQEKETRFMNDLRYYRNGIKYYGKSFDKEYGEKVLDFLNKIFIKLKKIAKKEEENHENTNNSN